jgi:subtilase family serine protease
MYPEDPPKHAGLAAGPGYGGRAPSSGDLMRIGTGLLAAATACALIGSAGMANASPGRAGGSAPGRGLAAASPPPTNAECRARFGVTCYSPRQLQRAYGLGPLYAKGYDGRGRTIVIVDPFGSPTIGSDLAAFDRGCGLPAPPAFRVLQPVGPVPPFNPDNAEMVAKAGETTLDVEWAHAMAPGADILLVETPAAETAAGGGFPQMMTAENYVIEHNLGDVISQSFSLPEQNFPSRAYLMRLRYPYLSALRHRVTVLAASNDNGVTGPDRTGAFYHHRVVQWPASDPLVTGVGGTRLHLTKAGTRTAPDTAWNDTWNTAVAALGQATPPVPWASSGGLSTVFARPGYQDPVRRVAGGRRGVPDISVSAAFSGAVLIFSTYQGARRGWGVAGGTSEATPEFAGIVAIADQYAGQRLGLINPALYQLEAAHAPGIVDVTRGGNSMAFVQHGTTFNVRGYRAGLGYDLVTGVGTIDAARFVPELAGAAKADGGP